MSDRDDVRSDESTAELGRYCRQVEAHLTRANGGHLVRVVGPAFDLVRQWAFDGVPLSVVFEAIDQKAERHRAGAARHPLRIEFCEADVRALFDHWRRAVGLAHRPEGQEPADRPPAGAEGRLTKAGPSLTKHLTRAIDRLTRVAGRTDVPEGVRDLATAQLTALAELRTQARAARGPARRALIERLAPMDADAAAAARAATSPDVLRDLRQAAERDLGPYRGRLDGQAWARAVEVTVDRLLRERFGLPVLEL